MPESVCVMCKETIQYELLECLGRTFDFKPMYCDRCLVEKDRKEKAEIEQKRVDSALSCLPYRFDRRIGNLDAMKAIGQAAFINGRPSDRSLWIGGATGAGKTTGVCGVLEVWVQRSGSFRFLSCNEMTNTYSEKLGESQRDANEYRSSLANERRLLVIDDLGVGPITNRGEELIEAIINTRMEKKLATWVTSNLRIEGMKNWFRDSLMAERVIRRLKDVFTEIVITRRKS